MDKKVTRILLIGKDPIFAWAIGQKIGALGYHLEHVYTLAEARLRMSRFQYTAVLLDGLPNEEVDLVFQNRDPESAVFVFNDTSVEVAPEIMTGPESRPVLIPKESAISKVVSSLKQLH